jgi:hypothetical protein
VPKVIASQDISRGWTLLAFSDERWARITATIPEQLSPEANARLRDGITAQCSGYLTQQSQVKRGLDSAAAMRRPGKGQLAPLERLAKGLRMAADAWREIGKIHDDRLSDIDEYRRLEPMARDAERRLAVFVKLGKPLTQEGPWREFVCRVADCCVEAGLNPTRTNRFYDDERAKPTWFQQFMMALNDNLLGDNGKNKQLNYRKAAFYAEIAKAMSGYKKTGKPRK